VGALDGFLPQVAQWFADTFREPSPAQVAAWPAIQRRENVLLLAPTGSGKTLAAFLCAIDDLLRRGLAGDLNDGIHVLYISPLKALGNDIRKNLLVPLTEIRERFELPEIRVAVRTGDTPQSERQRMIRQPPHILITTPESLYLMLGSERLGEALAPIRTVIVDEVHALCDNKRGVHLAVSLERLQERLDAPVQRIGCSATLSPLSEIAAFLVGNDAEGKRRPCSIVDAGMRKDLDVQVIAPLPDFVEAGNTALWASAYELLLREIRSHTTTLVFANSRYKAERTALRLGELADDGKDIGVHHGSMSKETRLEAEDALKGGRLKALIATASLELGIDIGSVDLVYQLESPKSVATGLQRIGRAGHLLDATSKGGVLVFERDEVLEAAAVCRAMVAGEVDAIRIPRGCLDVLAQQIVGAVVERDRTADEVLALVRRAYSYADLRRSDFDSVLAMLAGEHRFEMARAPRPLVLWDCATGKLSPARSAAQVSAMCVGTIGETSEYEVVIGVSNKRVGTVQSEFVDDALRVGDVFVLGSSAWKVEGVRRNRLIVEEAPGSTPTVPWWTGPIESRTVEVGSKVGRLRREVAERLHDPDLHDWLRSEYYLCPHAAEAVIEYVREQAAASAVPDETRVLVETWRDELGRQNIIVHCPLGQRINRTWGVALVQAAKERFHEQWTATASNDLLLLTQARESRMTPGLVDAPMLLGAVDAESVPELVEAAAAGSAGTGSAFREAAVCAFQVLRAWQGKRVPLWLQNYRSQELQEAVGGQADYPVAVEVARSYLRETLDVPALVELLRAIEAGPVALEHRQVESPSPFAHSLLVQGPYRDDHQMGRDRRAHLLRLHRQILQEVLSEEQMAELLDQRAIERLEQRLGHTSEATRTRNADELAQALRDLGDVPATVASVSRIVDGNAAEMLAELVGAHRVVAVRLPECERDAVRLVPADLWRQYYDAFERQRPGRRPSVLIPTLQDGEIVGLDMLAATNVIPPAYRKKATRDEARSAIVERYLRSRGPVTSYEIMNATGWPIGLVEGLLDGLVADGKAACGVYTAEKPTPQWVNRANLEEIHRLTLGYLKRELAACAPREVVDFMTRWQHLHPETRLRGVDGLRIVIGQLQGLEVVQGAWETELLPGRVEDYGPEMLDGLVASGEVCWGRVSPRSLRRGPIALCLRRDVGWIAGASPLEFDPLAEADCDIPDVIAAAREYFRTRKTAFFDELVADTGLDEGALTRAVWHLAWCGELTCDTYECIRHAGFQSSLSACYDLDSTPRKILSGRITAERPLSHMRRRKLNPRLGRWSATERLVPPARPLPEGEVVSKWSELLLARWGIVSRDMVAAEVAAPPWGKLVREFKRLELLGKIQRGFFIESHQGEQYGLPEAIELLRDCRATRPEGATEAWLEDEPLLAVTNREPANLYATCLEVTDNRGDVLKRGMRHGNLVARAVLQAGQVLVYEEHQLAPLSRRQLARCLAELQHDYAGNPVQLWIRHWNGLPLDMTPAAAVLWEVGFRRDGRDGFAWPPPARARNSDPTLSILQQFPPYYEQGSPVEFGPELAAARADPRIRPALAALYGHLEREFGRAGWEVTWHPHGPSARYRKVAQAHVWAGKTFADLHIRTRPLLDNGSKRRLWRRLRVEKAEDVNDGFVELLRTFIKDVTELVDRCVPPSPQ